MDELRTSSHLSPGFAEAASAGLFLRRPDGSTYVADVWHGSYPACGILDFTNPEAVEWFQGLLRPLLRQGVAVFKTDFAEGVPADAVAANGMTGTELHNVYSLLFNDVVAEVTREVAGHAHGLGPLVVPGRAAALGPVGRRHQRHLPGDGAARCAAACRTGCPACRSGATTRAASPVRPTADLYVRWAQFGALSPLVRFHGTTSRLPWDFPADAEQAAVEALRLRYRLMPYLYSAAVRVGPHRRADDARAAGGLPRRPGRVAGRPGVPARPRPAGRADDRPDRHPRGSTCPRASGSTGGPARSTPAARYVRVTHAAGPDAAVRPPRRRRPTVARRPTSSATPRSAR